MLMALSKNLELSYTLCFDGFSRIISVSFMNNKKTSIDGFIPRRAGSEIGERHEFGRVINGSAPQRKELKSEDDLTSSDVLGTPRVNRSLGRQNTYERASIAKKPHSNGRSDIAASLSEIDDIELPPKKKLSRKDRRRAKREARTKAQKIRRRILFGLMWLVIAVVVAAIGWVVFRALNASSNVLQGNIFDIVQSQPLKEDANGRSNFLIFGTAEDDEGGTHDGAYLTDSIMVMSVDQDKKDAYMVSLPRDLWVEMEMPEGQVCTVGYQEKLNSQFQCGSNFGEDEKLGAELLSKKVAEITGLDIQYYVHLNFTAVVEAVDAVGGIDVTIPDYDPNTPGILDRNFDWKCNYQCYYVNYKDGERVHMDGEHALAFARARNAQGGYGLPNSNFDREKSQQLIIKLLLEKATSAGTLTNIGAVTGLLDALGNNLRTNIATKEVRTLMELGSKMNPDNMISISLNEDGKRVVTTGTSAGGASIVRPVAGMFDYSGIHAYIKKQISSEPYMKEEANLSVLNGSGTAGVAQTAAENLEKLSFMVGEIGNAPEGAYEKVEIYQITTDKPATAAKLEQIYGVKVKTTTPPASVLGTTDYLIIIGDATAVQ